MALRTSGHRAQVLFDEYNSTVDPKSPGDFASIFHWEVNARRVMTDITPFLSTQANYAPGPVSVIWLFRGYADHTGRVPADFHHLPVTFRVQFSRDIPGDEYRGDGFVEAYKLLSSVDGANSFEIIVRSSKFLQEFEQIGW